MKRKDLYRAIGKAISSNRNEVINAIKSASIKVPSMANDNELATIISRNVFTNERLAKNLEKIVVEKQYSNAIDPVSAIAEGVGSLFNFGNQLIQGAQSKNEAERQLALEQERARQEMIKGLFQKPKTNYLPYVIIGSVLLIGGIVVVSTLKK